MVNNMWTKRRHKVVFNILRFPFKIFFKFKYNFRSYKYKLEDKPYLILSNHLTTLDPFMVAASFDRPLYFMASSDLFSSRFGKLITWLVAPIPKSKSVKDLAAIKDCIRVSKEGGSIMIFPEGNRSYDGKMCYFDPAISKLAKMLKLDVVIYNIHGGYGIDPRWCYKGRRGKSYGEVKKIITQEEIQKMDNDELFKLIKEELTVDQFSENVIYKNRKNAEGLERVFYLCPVCGQIQSIYTKGNKVYCNSCGLEVTYHNDLRFSSDNEKFTFKYPYEWNEFQIDYVKSFDITLNREIYHDENIKLFKMHYRKKGDLLLRGNITLTNEKIVITNGEKTIEYSIDDIYSFTVLGKHKMNFYIGNDTIQVKGQKDFNALKYMQMYYHIKNIKDGKEDEFFGM